MRVLITGGAGYIGSHTAVELLSEGHEVIIFDNYSNSSTTVPERIARITGGPLTCFRGDLLRPSDLDLVIRDQGIDAVIHCAGFKAVAESVEDPLMYYRNNLTGLINLLDAMAEHDVRNLVFSSSATVYHASGESPYQEDSLVGANNPYGRTKEMSERVLADLVASDPTWAVTILRYFNPIGAHPSGLIGDDPEGIPANLLPYVARVAAGELPAVQIYGDDYDTPDGTGIRDYIHIMDLARGHVLALLENREPGMRVYNLGTGRGTSVKELIAAFEAANGCVVPSVVTARRPGDLPVVYADPTLARQELGFTPRYSLEEMCAHAWAWQRLRQG
ncbi:MAG: UDP-glucose 4-epimerase GalE [Propionibacteriaceae bacterium]|jgi:UDP-glucose 4-epimerase|nr:UDP-glucose 4-epimerase GalE [Propionibacteriaceae bacterium]